MNGQGTLLFCSSLDLLSGGSLIKSCEDFSGLSSQMVDKKYSQSWITFATLLHNRMPRPFICSSSMEHHHGASYLENGNETSLVSQWFVNELAGKALGHFLVDTTSFPWLRRPTAIENPDTDDASTVPMVCVWNISPMCCCRLLIWGIWISSNKQNRLIH